MNPTRDDIERIVRQVLDLLRTEANQGAGTCGTECKCSTTSAEKSSTGNGLAGPNGENSNRSTSAVCADRVITVASLGEYLDGVDRLVVQTGSVITPAAKDMMRDKGITWSVGDIGSEDRSVRDLPPRPVIGIPTQRQPLSANSPQNAKTTRPRRESVATTVLPTSTMPLIVGASGCTIEQQAAIDSATLGRWSVERTELGDLLGVVERVTIRIADGDCRGLLLTDRTSLAESLANRRRGVRAVAVREPEGVSYAVNSSHANLLIVDATTCNSRQIKAVVDAYRFARDS